MKTIDIKVIDDVIFPVSDFPKDAIKIVFDGEKYIVYELGDEALLDEQIHDSRARQFSRQ